MGNLSTKCATLDKQKGCDIVLFMCVYTYLPDFVLLISYSNLGISWHGLLCVCVVQFSPQLVLVSCGFDASVGDAEVSECCILCVLCKDAF